MHNMLNNKLSYDSFFGHFTHVRLISVQVDCFWNRFCLDPVRPMWDLKSSLTVPFQAGLHLWPMNSGRMQGILLQQKTTSRSPSPYRSPRGQRASTTADWPLEVKPATPSTSVQWVSKMCWIHVWIIIIKGVMICLFCTVLWGPLSRFLHQQTS